ncbi:MAG: hypothetical protein ABTQ34_03470 [Bdellovibrionales bacterium]
MPPTWENAQPDTSPILPDGPETALMASIQSRYQQLAQGFDESGSFLPTISEENLKASLTQNPLWRNKKELAALAESNLFKNPPRSIHMFSMRRLPFAIITSAADTSAMRYILPMLQENTRNIDVRQLTGEHFKVCTKHPEFMSPATLRFLRQTLSKLLIAIAVTGACLDSLQNPRPDNMQGYTLARDKAPQQTTGRRYADLKRFFRETLHL